MGEMKLLATAESRRRFGEGLWEWNPDDAVDWIAHAELMEAGTEDKYIDARDKWRAAEPKAIDFVRADVAFPLLERAEKARAENRARMQRLWGR